MAERPELLGLATESYQPTLAITPLQQISYQG